MNQNDAAQHNVKAPRRAFWSIRTKLAVGFSSAAVAVLLVVELVGMKGIPFTSFQGRQANEKDEAFRGLSLIADLKKERLTRWIEELNDDIHAYAENDMVRGNVAAVRAAAREVIPRNAADPQAWAKLRGHDSCKKLEQFLNTIRLTYESYEGLHISDAQTGMVIVSTDLDELGADDSKQQYFISSLTSQDSYMGDIQLGRRGKPTFYASHLIIDDKGKPAAVLVLEVLADDIIGAMLHTGEGLGKTGEALLVNQNLRILTSLKHRLGDGTTAKPLEYHITAKPALLAASGEEGIIEAKDYRGVTVLAAYRHIPIGSELGWGMVVKQDRAELFAPIRSDAVNAWSIAAVAIVLIILLSSFVARSLTRPLLELSSASERVSAGDLNARAQVATSDEVGRLAQTFNAMVEHIQGWHEQLEEQVRARTGELQAANKALTEEFAEHEHAEQERSKLIIKLEASNAELERFAYTVSHDLKSPLITIKGFLGVLGRDLEAGKTTRVQDNMARIGSAAEKMEQLLDELLELSRIGRLVNPPEDVPFGDLARGAVAMVSGRIEKSGATVEIAPELPTVHGDRPRLMEVMQNLVDNAAKYMGDQPNPTIKIGARENGDEITFYVRDNGVGIEPRYQQRIFGLFDKLDPKSDGSGIGLAIVKRIVEVHGGRIWVESEGAGHGSTFWLTLSPEKKGDN